MKQIIYCFFSLLVISFFCSCFDKKPIEINKIIKTETISQPYDTPYYLKQIKLYSTDKIKIVIDAGHGGEDPGAISDTMNIYEKDINRGVTNYLLQLIDTSLFYVFESRKKDKNTHRHTRIDSAWMLGPEALITIHTNSYKTDTSVNGFELSISDKSLDLTNYNPAVFGDENYDDSLLKSIPNPNADKGMNLCKSIQKYYQKIPEIKFNGYRKRDDRIWMIYAGNFPSILVEMGYISNTNDLWNLINPNVQQKIAGAIYEGLLDYFIANGKISTKPVIRKLKPIKWNKRPVLKTLDNKKIIELKKTIKDPKILKKTIDSLTKELNKPIKLDSKKIKGKNKDRGDDGV